MPALGKEGTQLTVKLLGSPAAFLSDESLNGFVSIKAQALLFYLAATGISHRRAALVALLWSDIPSNLRRPLGP